VKLNGCNENPKTEAISKDGDEMKVTRRSYSGGTDGAEVVLVVIEEGGHTWPGQQPPVDFIGRSVKSVSANDLIWEFFQRHKLN
jgi:polyhydroxybutyrate depolymerase